MIVNQPDIHGINIYRDRKGYVVYYNRFNDQAYRLMEEDKTRYDFLSKRLLVSLLSGILSYAVLMNMLISICITLVLYIVLSVWFYRFFLPSLPLSLGFERKEKNKPFESFVRGRSKVQFGVGIIAMIIAEGIICVLMNQELSPLSQKMYQILFLITAIVILFFIFCFIRKLKDK